MDEIKLHIETIDKMLTNIGKMCRSNKVDKKEIQSTILLIKYRLSILIDKINQNEQ